MIERDLTGLPHEIVKRLPREIAKRYHTGTIFPFSPIFILTFVRFSFIIFA
jgi:hypothetical protein